MALFDSQHRHDWDWITESCVKCGQFRSAVYQSDSPLRCLGGGNVAGVTHRVLRRAFERMLGGDIASAQAGPPAAIPKALWDYVSGGGDDQGPE